MPDFDLVRPCPRCPFRSDIDGFLTPGRAREIGEAVALHGRAFTCHETTRLRNADEEFGDEEMVDGPNAQHCAGALIFAERSGAQPPQLARIAERQGAWDPARMDPRAPVVESLSELVELHGGEVSEGEPCHVAEQGCLAPAGYACGGGVVDAVERDETVECVRCGEPVCEACGSSRDGGRVCRWCEEDEQ